MNQNNMMISHQLPEWFREWKMRYQHVSLPTKKQERWQYTDLTVLSALNAEKIAVPEIENLTEILHHYRLRHTESIRFVFVNGVFMPNESDLHQLPDGAIACSLQEAAIHHSALLQQYLLTIDAKKYPLAAHNISHCEAGFFFYLPENMQLSAPLHFLFLPFGDAQVAISHHMLVFERNSHATVLQEFFSLSDKAYTTHLVNHCVVNEDANMTFIKLQQEGVNANHFVHMFVQQAENSEMSLMQYASGAHFARNEIEINLNAKGATCNTAGFYLTQQDQQYVDHHIDIQHHAAHTQSQLLYKGIVDNKSRAVFNGRLRVDQCAQKIVAEQMNHHLLLSPHAEAYAKPALEIYADDVRCKHGATTGELNQDALFYLRARGIAYQDAVRLLLQSFAEEILLHVKNEAIRNYIRGMIHESTAF